MTMLNPRAVLAGDTCHSVGSDQRCQDRHIPARLVFEVNWDPKSARVEAFMAEYWPQIK